MRTEPRIDDAGERYHRNICRPATDVDDHVAAGLGNRQSCADGGHHGLLHKIDFAGLGSVGRVFDRAFFHLGNFRRHTNNDPRMHQHLPVVGFLDEVVEHFLSYFEVGDYAVLHGLDGHDVAGRSAQHLLGFLAHRFYFACIFVNGHDRRLVDHNALAGSVDERIGGSQINGQITGKHAKKRAQSVRSRGARRISVQ